MNNVIQYAAVNTKIKAIEGQLLTDEDWLALMNKETVPDIVRYLKQTSYREAFSGYNEADLHRGQIEALLKRFAVDKLIRLKHYYRGPQAKFLKILLMQYEVEDLKILIRAIETDRSYIGYPNLFAYISRYGELNFDRLAASANFAELMENLKGTPWYSYLVPFLKEGERLNHFLVEMALDLAYISMYKQHLELLSEEEKRKIYELRGIRADLLNIQWIYRGKKFYHLSPEILLNYSISFGRRLNAAAIKSLCYASDVSELEGMLKDGRYGFLFNHDNTKDIFMERRIYRYIYYQLLKYRRKNSLDMVQTIIFFALLEFEIRDMITIIENIRYHREDPEQIKRCLIRDL